MGKRKKGPGAVSYSRHQMKRQKISEIRWEIRITPVTIVEILADIVSFLEEYEVAQWQDISAILHRLDFLALSEMTFASGVSYEDNRDLWVDEFTNQ